MPETMTRDVAEIVTMSHREAMRLADTEYRRFADLLDALTAADWARSTSCPGWTVREIAGHVLGAMRGAASPGEQRRQLKAARAHGGSIADGLSSEQVFATASLSSEEVRHEIRNSVGRAVRGRQRVPTPVRSLVRVEARLPVSGKTEKWTLAYLIDHVLTRDVWMHRLDICDAVGAPFLATPEHDGRLVELIVADWARRHRRDFDLSLRGPAGGTFSRGDQAAGINADAVEFCRSLSGRADTLPLNTEVPF